MLNHDFTAKLLNLEEVIITNVENEGEILHIHLELPRRDHVCPCCGEKTNRIHDYRLQTVKDKPLGQKTLLHLRKPVSPVGKDSLRKTIFYPDTIG